MALNNVADIIGKSSVAAPDKGMAGELAVKNDNVQEYKNATTPVGSPGVSAARMTPNVDKVNPSARFGARSGEQRLDTGSMTKQLGSFEKGTSHVPKTGTYKLHEGEAVIPKDKNMHTDKMKAMLSDEGGAKPKKEIKSIETHKSHDGKFLHTHKHHSASHPDETHVSNDMSEVHKHMEDHMGQANEGEAAPTAGAEPAPMTAAPSPAPAPSPMPGQ